MSAGFEFDGEDLPSELAEHLSETESWESMPEAELVFAWMGESVATEPPVDAQADGPEALFWSEADGRVEAALMDIASDLDFRMDETSLDGLAMPDILDRLESSCFAQMSAPRMENILACLFEGGTALAFVPEERWRGTEALPEGCCGGFVPVRVLSAQGETALIVRDYAAACAEGERVSEAQWERLSEGGWLVEVYV